MFSLRPDGTVIPVNSIQRLLVVFVAFVVYCPSQQIEDQIRARTPGVAVWWTGNAGWLIRSGDLVIAIDLDLSTAQKI
jgi:photosystem II stability/assembly factor-like uncharacterized protein